MSSSDRFDLLATCLRIAEVEDFLDIFEKHGIDSFCLKSLNREDLTALGITEESKQDLFLDKISTLQIPSEEIKGVEVDQEYVQLVVYLMSSHLQRHLASLSCALLRNDVVVNDINLTPSLRCLERCIVSLRDECRKCRMLICKPRRNWKKYIVRSALVGGFLVGSFVLVRFVLMK